MTDLTIQGAEQNTRAPISLCPQEIEIGGKRFYTEDGLAAALDKSTRTLKRWHDLRIGPPRISIGKTILYPVEGTGEWLLAQAQEPPAQRRRSRRAGGR